MEEESIYKDKFFLKDKKAFIKKYGRKVKYIWNGVLVKERSEKK